MLRLAAAWVLPVLTPPLEAGAVLIGASGRILAVGPATEVPLPPGVPSVELRGGILAPGFVNTHTHLELTGLDGRVDEDEFSDWIRSIRREKARRTRADSVAAARQGVVNEWATGVTTLADTGDTGAAWEALCAEPRGGAGICYHEVFGPHPGQRDESHAGLVAAVTAMVAAGPPPGCSRVTLGVSPHAPYSVSGPLYRAVAAYARESGRPIALHLAESVAERDLVTRSAGPFAEAWRARGIPLPDDPAHGAADPARRSPVAWADAHEVLGPRTLVIHAVDLDGEDIAVLAARGVGVAHCPRSNLRHHGRTAPLSRLLAAGIPVGLGTDSVASVSPADLRAEARLVVASGLSAERAAHLLTRGGAMALGLAQVGGLAPGWWGDLTAVTAGDGVADPHEALLDASNPVTGTWIAGRKA